MISITRKQKIFLAAGFVALQVLALGGLWFYANYPHYVGKKVLLGIQPVDPRSLFRGQFVRLNYEIGRLSDSIKTDDTADVISPGTTVYVTLQQQGTHWKATKLSTSKPAKGTFIRGKISRGGWQGSGIRYGIEAYFTDAKHAKKIERDFLDITRAQRQAGQRGTIATAEIMLAPNGQASLVGLQLPE